MVQLAAVALSFILVALLVVTSSRAAFVAQSDNTANQVTSATINLTDNDSNTAMFNNITLMPNVNVDRCIDVTYNGSIDPTAVILYSSGAPTGTLAPFLNLTVDMASGPGSGFGSCTGFPASGTTNVYTGTLQGFAGTYAAYASGLPTWDPSGTAETRSFRFRLAVQDTDAAKGLTTTFGFSWETRTP